MPRSLRVQELHLPKVKACLLRNGFPSQKLLAEALGISQSTVSNFLNGRPVDYANFLELCQILGQEWRDLADLGADLDQEPELPSSPFHSPADLRGQPTPQWPTFPGDPIFVPASVGDSRPTLSLPEGQVPLGSGFYVPRPPIETLCQEAIAQPGALIRIKAPHQMGKTSLLTRILQQAAAQGSRIVNLNLQLANKRVFASADTFLQWFCASLGLELQQLDALNACWQLAEMIGSSQCCRVYLEQQLLADPAPPLALGIDQLDRVFEFPEIADDFLGLLRSLHEEAKRRPIWQKLRLVLVHSTEVYVPLDINRSPFNVGLPIELPEFTPAQVHHLVQLHGLDWEQATIDKLMDLIGGHPYLVRLTLYHLAQGTIALPALWQTATNDFGIYGEHLRRHWWSLTQYPELMTAIKSILKPNAAVVLETKAIFCLQGMGLIRLEGNTCRVRCQLYDQYLRDCLSRHDWESS